MGQLWKWSAFSLSTGVGAFMIHRYMTGKKCTSTAVLTNKTVIITGASSGIGKATALELAKRHGRVIMACRDLEKAERAVKEIRAKTNSGELVVMKLDLASFKSVRQFAEEICRQEKRIDVLINNAGVYNCPYQLTEDGLEMQMAVNHFGHFLLTNLLLDKLKDSAPSRVVIVSSGLHRRGTIDFSNLNGEQAYSPAAAYNASKLANNLFAHELARRVHGSGVSVHCLRPGMVRTDLDRHVEHSPLVHLLKWPVSFLVFRSPYEGCQTVVHCAVADELAGVSGQFYANCAPEPWSQVSLDDDVSKRLWDVSEQLTGITSSNDTLIIK